MRVLIVLFVVLLSPLLAEVILYPGFTLRYLQVQPLFIVSLATLGSLLVRFFAPKPIWQKMGLGFVYFLAPVTTVLAVLLRTVELLTYPNFVYQTLHLDPTQLGLLGAYLIIIGLPLLDVQIIRKYWKISLVVFSLLLYQALLWYWVDLDLFFILGQEDGLVEYATFVVYLAAAACSFLSLRWVKKLPIKKRFQQILRALLVLVTIGLVLIAGEEISWGQRILDLQTPQYIAQHNTQQEINIHNNKLIFGYVYKAYFVVNLYGLASWIGFAVLRNRVRGFRKILLRIMTTRPYLLFFFVPNLVYVSLLFMYGNAVIDKWEEITELFLAFGIAATWYLNLRYLQANTISSKK